MSNSIRLISDEIIIHYSDVDEKKLLNQKNYIFPSPNGKRLIICFSSESSYIHPFTSLAIKENLGVVYVCDKLPENPIISKNIIYLECPFKWFVHTLFINPLQFCAVFSTDKTTRLAQAFSEFMGYIIPVIHNEKDILSLSTNFGNIKNKILVEIIGGVGDHLLTIPALKTLDAKGYRVDILCEPQRSECFQNLPYVKTIFSKRRDIITSSFSKIIYLHFGQHLNDYRMELNKQNRIYAVAELCGLNKDELVIDKPEIILTKDEINNAKRKYDSYPNKLFFGSDSARVDAKIPNTLVQEKINFLKSKGFTVFSSSNRRNNFDNCIDLNKKISLRELFSLISLMDCVLTVDTSFLHIAAAFNKRTFALVNYFKGDWRCGTYKNCSIYTPSVPCYPCVAKQFVSSRDWHCHKNSCYDFFPWNNICEDIYNFKLDKDLKEKELINTIDVTNTPVLTTESDIVKVAPGNIISARKDLFGKKIAAIWLGGIGDAIMLGYLCRAIKDKYPNCLIDAFVRDEKQVSLFLFDYPDIKGHISKLSWDETLKEIKNNYDIIYEFRRYPYVWHSDETLNQSMDKTLYSSWSKASEKLLSNYKGKNIFEIYAESTDLILKEENLRIPLDSLNFGARKSRLSCYSLPENFITIAPGCDQHNGIMKLWKTNNWEELINLLKSDGLKVVYLGDKKAPEISNVLRLECKSLIDMLLILSQSKLHISNEGGSIHLAHAVGTKSISIFGPTNPELYGYKDNINIYANICPTCWWLTPDWSKRCKLGYKDCLNLNNISVEQVYNEVWQYLK